MIAEDDCRASKACENEGRCSADIQAAVCVATSQTDCEASDDCVHVDDETGLVKSIKNRCTLSGERCVASNCEGVSVCEQDMCCDLVDGKCVRL